MQPDSDTIARRAIGKMSWRILPLIALGYLFAFMDRVNISFASLDMNEDLAFSATVYGLGAGLFYLAYALFEVPSNIFLTRFGARRWIARIMISWGILAAGMMFVQTPLQFYVMRFLLGMAEAGFFPGVIYYLSHWYPRTCRGRAVSRFYIAGPLASVMMGAISGALLDLDGLADLRGWQWLFLVQGAPAVLMGLIILRYLPDAPATASWLNPEEKAWIQTELARDAALIGEPPQHSLLDTLRDPVVLQFGIIGMLTIGSMVTLSLSAPKLLANATGYDPTQIGYIVGAGGILGALSMLFTGWYSDRLGNRFRPMLVSTGLMACAFLTISLAASSVVIIGAFLLFAISWPSVTLSQVTAWPDVLHIRSLAVGCAAINSMSQIGAFVLPYSFGVMRDATGGFAVGLMGLFVAAAMALLLTLIVRRHAHNLRPIIYPAEMAGS